MVAKIKVRTWKQSTEIATGKFYKDDLSKPGHRERRWKGSRKHGVSGKMVVGHRPGEWGREHSVRKMRCH